ncbi:MAG: threonine--tRNA ligase, partial [Thermomicrobiales bacterium]
MASDTEELEHMDIAVDTENTRDFDLARMRHSTAHVMAEAVQEIFPDAKFAIGPAIANGFYYDMELPRPLTPDDLKEIEKRMRHHKKKNEVFERKE